MHSSALIAPIRYSVAMKRALSGLASHGSTTVIQGGWMIALPTNIAWASTNRKYSRSQVGTLMAQPLREYVAMFTEAALTIAPKGRPVSNSLVRNSLWEWHVPKISDADEHGRTRKRSNSPRSP